MAHGEEVRAADSAGEGCEGNVVQDHRQMGVQFMHIYFGMSEIVLAHPNTKCLETATLYLQKYQNI